MLCVRRLEIQMKYAEAVCVEGGKDLREKVLNWKKT